MRRITALLAALLLPAGLSATMAAGASASTSPPAVPPGPAPAGVTAPQFNTATNFNLVGTNPACTHGVQIGVCNVPLHDAGHNVAYVFTSPASVFHKVNVDGPYVELEDGNGLCINTNGSAVGADSCIAGDANELWYIFGPPDWIIENVRYSGSYLDAGCCIQMVDNFSALGNWYITFAAPAA